MQYSFWIVSNDCANSRFLLLQTRPEITRFWQSGVCSWKWFKGRQCKFQQRMDGFLLCLLLSTFTVYYTYLKRKDSSFGKRQAKIQFSIPSFHFDIGCSTLEKPWQRTKRLYTRVRRSEDEKRETRSMRNHLRFGSGVTTVLYREGLKKSVPALREFLSVFWKIEEYTLNFDHFWSLD